MAPGMGSLFRCIVATDPGTPDVPYSQLSLFGLALPASQKYDILVAFDLFNERLSLVSQAGQRRRASNPLYAGITSQVPFTSSDNAVTLSRCSRDQLVKDVESILR